jgi:hypothetical protein
MNMKDKVQGVLGWSLTDLDWRYLGRSAFREGSDTSYRPAQIRKETSVRDSSWRPINPSFHQHLESTSDFS